MVTGTSRFLGLILIWDFVWFWAKQSSPSVRALGGNSVRLWERPCSYHNLVALSHQDRWEIKSWDFGFGKLLWASCVFLQERIYYAAEVTKATVTNGMRWAALCLVIGASLARRGALQILKQLSLAVEERRWSLLEASNVNLHSDLLACCSFPK